MQAKGTSQYICASMLGTVAGASACGVMGQDLTAALMTSAGMSIVTLGASYTTVQTIPLPTLNGTRLQVREGGFSKVYTDSS